MSQSCFFFSESIGNKSENKVYIADKISHSDALLQTAFDRIAGCACMRHSVLIWFTLLEWRTLLEIMHLMCKLWARTAPTHFFSAPYLERVCLWRNGAAQINPCYLSNLPYFFNPTVKNNSHLEVKIPKKSKNRQFFRF